MSGNAPGSTEKDLFRIVRGIRDLFEGRRNTTGTVTLAVSPATTTVVSPVNFGTDSVPHLIATTANAAAALATTFVSARASGSFTLTHASSAQVDRTFLYSFDG